MMRALLATAALGILLFTGVAFADAPTKEQVKEAEPHFFKGVDFFNESDFPNAVIEFKKAYEIAPDFHVLFNVGQACYQAQNYACALDAFNRYLNDGGTQVQAKRRSDIEKDIKKLIARVSKVEITTNVDGALVTIDDEKIGTTPLKEPIPMSQGKRKIVVTKDGYEPITDTVDIAGGDTKRLGFDLKEIPKLAPPVVLPPKVVHRSPAPFIAAGVTGALVVGAVITGIVALSASSSANSKLGTFGANPDEIKNAESQASTFALVTDILGGAAILGAAATVVLFVVTNKSTKEQPAPSPKPAYVVTPLVGPGSFGLAARF